jgi:ankyrin repeat protein
LTPLVDAVMARKAEAVEALLAGKADPNLGRMTPLSLAVTGTGDDVGPDLAMVRRLLNAGADVGRRDSEGFPPLLRAIAMASYVMDGAVGDVLGVVRVLLEAKADPNQSRDGPLLSHEAGQTPLLHAVCQRNLKMTEALLDAGARIHEARSTNGRTPLHLATLHLDRPMVELLLARGADPRLKSGANQTPLDQIRNTSSEAAGTVGVGGLEVGGPVTVQLTGPGFVSGAGGGASGDPANPETQESRMEAIQELLRTWQPPKP